VPLVYRVRDALRAAPDTTATLAALWRQTRGERRALLNVLHDLTAQGLARSLDPTSRAGALRDISDHDDRRWQLTDSGREQP